MFSPLPQRIFENSRCSYGMDDTQMSQMNTMSGMQLSDPIDFALENIDMYTSSFN